MHYKISFQRSNVALAGNARSRVSTSLQISGLAVLVAIQGVLLTAAGMSQAQPPAAEARTPQAAPKPPVKKRHTLRVTKDGIIGVSLKADKAKLSDVAIDLSKRLGVKVVLGPAMQKVAITVEFVDLTLEPALRLLAPRVYVDYEIRADAQPLPLGILLLGDTDPEPSANAIIEGSSQAMLVEGNTEDIGPGEDDDPLQVDFDDENNHLTIKSKKQPLSAVLMTIADVMGVPAELKYDANEIVDTEIKDTLFEDAIPRLSPNIRLYVRDDLTRTRKTALRLTLVAPAARTAGQ